ncbi:PE domain-containing protein [Mycobacterium spongiae]|uniref:PE domain-containing protein n=1 Tax=Mycobacterium spongiae TaxID=886343 RepID=A0A975K0E7_9MYCO|nr:PE domain-containing protein [Mycobacterium spongiae]
MSYVVAVPEVVAAAATDLAGIGSTLTAANVAAVVPTTGVLVAGADEVSAAVAELFSAHAQAYQVLNTQMAGFHAQFVQALTGAGGAYAAGESVNASSLAGVQHEVLAAIDAPTLALLGRPLIGNGADGVAPGQAGGAGGLLYGNGGNGAAGVNPGVAGVGWRQWPGGIVFSAASGSSGRWLPRRLCH